MDKFFKIVFPDGKSFVVVSSNGYTGLIGLLDGVKDKDNTFITQISFCGYIKYVMKSIFTKRRKT